MADFTTKQVLEMVARGEALERADLSNLELTGARLAGANLRRSGLRGANLEACELKKANLSAADLREAHMAGANLEGANLQKADLEATRLDGANLKGADLSRANLERAQLDKANLRAANLENAYCESARFPGAILERGVLEGANLLQADLSKADLRGSDLRQAKLDGCKLTGAKLVGAKTSPAQFQNVEAEWVDFSTRSSEVKVPGPVLADYLDKLERGESFAVPSAAAQDKSRRYFGEGDVMGGATLEFGDGSLVEVESRFEDCSITLNDGARLIIGPSGVFEGCKIDGAGEIIIHGSFSENGKSPSIVGPKRLIVAKDGSLIAAVQQAKDATEFGFERGCHLRLKIRK